MRNILVMGGTGAMGVYLIPELIRQGYRVDVTSRSWRRSGLNVRYIEGDAKNDRFLGDILKNNYDAIIDFMAYSSDEFQKRLAVMLSQTSHYIFISTYRVFSDEDEYITESTLRLLDTSNDKDYIETDEYALSKAREENMLRSSGRRNWTIVRPSITYSKNRFQLGVLECENFVLRSLEGKPIVFPLEMLDKKTTMTWAGDVAKMIARLVLDKSAFGEDYNVVTSESRTWREVITYYRKILKIRIRYVTLQEFLKIYANKYQVIYDRMFNRTMDNTKILNALNMNQEDLMPLERGLKRELGQFIKNPVYGHIDSELNRRMDSLAYGRAHRALKQVKPRTRLLKIKRLIRPRARLRSLKQQLRIRTRTREFIRIIRNNKKAGLIVSLTSVFNYGNIIQRYALKTFLRQKGYDFDSLDIPSWTDEIDDTIFGETRNFIKKYIGGVEFDNRTLQGYKRYIVGSDQVWRNWYDKDMWNEFSPYFLEFVNDKRARRISYAASFGVDSLKGAGIDDSNIDKIRSLLNRFDKISVREESGASLVDHICGHDKHAKLVLDPTMLLGRDEYSRVIDVSTVKTSKIPKLFCYILDPTDTKEKMIKEISHRYDNDYLIMSPRADKRYDPVELWLKGFRDAECIITDSFHGVVFSIINKKEFIVFNNKDRGSARFNTLFSTLGINHDRLVDAQQGFNFSAIEPIDWIKVGRLLEEGRKYSQEWLLASLEGDGVREP